MTLSIKSLQLAGYLYLVKDISEEEELEDAAELTEICMQDTGIGYVPSCITSEKA